MKNHVPLNQSQQLLEIKVSEKKLNAIAKLLEIEPREFQFTIELPIITVPSQNNKTIVFFMDKKKPTVTS